MTVDLKEFHRWLEEKGVPSHATKPEKLAEWYERFLEEKKYKQKTA